MTPLRAGLWGGVAAFAFYAGVMNTMMHGWLAWYRLARDGQPAQATITGRQPENHQTCHFEFYVGPKKYEGSDEGCHVRIGDTVQVTYSPTDPHFATTVSPADELTMEIVGAVGLSCFAGFAIGWQLREKQRKSTTGGRPTIG